MDETQGHTADALPLIIAISSSCEERSRMAELLDGFGPLILVSTVDEARSLLEGRTRAGTTADIRRSPPAGRVREIAGIRIDSDLLVATKHGRQVELTPLERRLLLCLGSEPRRTWSHSALHEEVWHSQRPGQRADIHSVVKRLRRKLAELGAPVTIEAVRGVGLRLIDRPE